MAAGRDIRRETARIRREQAKRNADAVAEAQARRDAMGSPKPSDKRRRAAMVPHNPDPKVHRQGHRVSYETKSLVEGVIFASATAQKIAEESGLTAEQFAEFNSASDKGFTAADVRNIIAFYKELNILDEQKAGEVEVEGEGEGEQKMGRPELEDKMDRHEGGEDK